MKRVVLGRVFLLIGVVTSLSGVFLFILSFLFSAYESGADSEIIHQVLRNLNFGSVAILVIGILLLCGALMFRKEYKYGKHLVIISLLGLIGITAYSVWQTSTVFGISTIFALLATCWIALTSIFGYLIVQAKKN